MPTFGERLRDLRQGAGMTQAELATASGLPLGSIRNYEQGQREPLWDVVFRLAEAMRVSCEAFKECLDASHREPEASAPIEETRRRGRSKKAEPTPAEPTKGKRKGKAT